VATTDPANYQDYLKKTHKHTKLEGFGLEEITQHQPCPWCAEPGFWIFHVLDIKEVTSQDTTCQHCGRSGKLLYHEDTDSSTVFELVQTGGEDAPSWFDVAPRRIDT
jgi:hypothetical protein